VAVGASTTDDSVVTTSTCCRVSDR
jgi:hypothetical protein